MSDHKAVVLLSGGLDSTTCLAIAKAEGFTPYALSFRYGQRHLAELDAAKKLADQMGVAEHVIADIDLRVFGGSALTSDIEVPKDRPEDEMTDGIPVTYVPARNTVFLSFALAWADVLQATDIFIGVNALDYSGYPDCRPAFIEAFRRAADAGTRDGSTAGDAADAGWWRIHTPLLELTKAQIVSRGHALGVDHSLTLSCYDPTPTGLACGRCDSCGLRRRGFEEAGLDDPTPYAE